MSDKLVPELVELLTVDSANDLVPIYDASAPSELKFVKVENLAPTIPDASDTVKGIVELATTAETTTGTDAVKAVTPDGLHDMTSIAGAGWILDEDNMASDSNTKLPTQQSVKAYVDSLTSSWRSYTAVTPTRASADDPTYVLTFAGIDLTSVMSVGMKVKMTQSAATVYGIITALSFSTDTTMTIYGGTDYDVDDTATYAISAFQYSTDRAPQGFPLDPTKWQVRVTDVTQRGGTTTASTWTNHGTTNAQISLPIGAWAVNYSVAMLMDIATAGTDITCKVTLSTANNSESDSELTSVERWGSAVANSADIIEMTFARRKFLVVSSKTLYYLNAWNNSGNDQYWNNNLHPMVLEAACAYL